MSHPSQDLTLEDVDRAPVVDGISAELPDAPPPSPNGRVLYDDLGLRIDRDGIWHYHGSPIQRKELVCLFASALLRDGEGRHWLVTPTEMGPIEVEDAPFIAIEMFVAGRGQSQVLSLRTNVDEIVTIDESHPLFVDKRPGTGEAAPYVVLGRGLRARLSRSVYYELAGLAVATEIDGRQCFAVWSNAHAFPLGYVDEGS